MTESLVAAGRSTHLPANQDCERIWFGDFALFPVGRMLYRRGQPLPLGSRALDILIVLVDKAGQVVSHRELIAKVWRGLVVDHGNLRVQINGLRKALGEGEAGVRYIANIPGQGYSFVAPIHRFAPHRREVSQTPLEIQTVLDAIASAIGAPLEAERVLGALIERLSQAR